MLQQSSTQSSLVYKTPKFLYVSVVRCTRALLVLSVFVLQFRRCRKARHQSYTKHQQMSSKHRIKRDKYKRYDEQREVRDQTMQMEKMMRPRTRNNRNNDKRSVKPENMQHSVNTKKQVEILPISKIFTCSVGCEENY